MDTKFVSVSVKPETRKAIRRIAVEQEIRMYEVAEKLVEKGNTIFE